VPSCSLSAPLGAEADAAVSDLSQRILTFRIRAAIVYSFLASVTLPP
jgi:hypothetical protein